MALIGHTLHFTYLCMLEMDLSEFSFFVDQANEIAKVQNNS